MPDFIKGFRNIKKNSPRVSWWVKIKTLIDFHESPGMKPDGLCKKFFLHKTIKQRIEYKPFKDFTKDREKMNWTISFHQIFTLFIDWYYIIFFLVLRENTFL